VAIFHSENEEKLFQYDKTVSIEGLDSYVVIRR